MEGVAIALVLRVVFAGLALLLHGGSDRAMARPDAPPAAPGV